MEYTNTSYLDSQGFVSLLESQTIDLDSPELPRFSSQASEESSVKHRRPWTPTEDVILIGAWLNTSKDPVVSNEQKSGAFWQRITNYYNASPVLEQSTPRELGQCKQRWSRINDMVCKFVGCHDAALREQRSGQNDNNVMKAALDIYYNDYNSKFSLEHAWRELRHDNKWCSSISCKDGGKEKRKGDGEGDEEVSEQRPPCVKAAKAAKRNKTGKEEELTKLEGLLDRKEKLSKQKLFVCLMTKSDPLSEIETSLKLKLMGEML